VQEGRGVERLNVIIWNYENVEYKQLQGFRVLLVYLCFRYANISEGL